jgi:hypothetical protein
MLIEMLREIERQAEPAPADKNPFGPVDKEWVQGLITRLRRNMCQGCPWAARRHGASFEASLCEAPQPFEDLAPRGASGEDITSC